MELPDRRRVVIEGIRPQVDGGRFPIKRVIGDEVLVEADVFADGHDFLVALLQHRHERESTWHEQPMQGLGNDRWRAKFSAEKLGKYFYRIVGWVDRFHTWRHDLKKRADAGQDLHVDLLIGAGFVEAAADRAALSDAERLREFAVRIAGAQGTGQPSQSTRCAAAMDDSLLLLMDTNADRSQAAVSPELGVAVDDERAAFSAWYEFFPRSLGTASGRHGNFHDAISHLSYVESLGFNVIYLPPIHPIGKAFRKG